MKSFAYAGGKITLAIPSEWIEEREADEVRLYYQEVPQSGGFRVRVKTFGGSKAVTSDMVAGLLLGMAGQTAPEKTHAVATLPDGNPLVAYVQAFPDDNPPLLMASWLVGIAVPPRHIQIASFTYTASMQDAGSPVVAAEMQLLAGCVQEATYAVDLEDPEPSQKKAWWRRRQ